MLLRYCLIVLLALLCHLSALAEDGQASAVVRPCTTAQCNESPSRSYMDQLCDRLMGGFRCGRCRTVHRRTPAMIGDYFVGPAARLSGPFTTDQLLVLADDLDAPAVLPPAGSQLTITEAGPVGIFETSLSSIQEVQALLRAGSPLPPLVNVGNIADNATLTTTDTIAQIQAQLASTPEGYDIITLLVPPGSYDTAVDGVFVGRNALAGTTVYNTAGSGAVLQGGVDSLTGGEDFDAYYFYQYQVAVNLLLPQITGGGVGRLKIAEGGSVLPEDRVYFRYSYIDDVATKSGGAGLSRFTPGIERTFGDGLFSFELRAPFAGTVSSVTTNGTQSFGSSNAEIGNMAMYLKALLYHSSDCVISGGIGLEVPTADDIRVTIGGTPLLEVANDDVHIQPFLGALRYWNDDWFTHGFLQFDFAAGENDIRINNGAGLSDAGAMSDSNYVFADIGLGYWLYRGNTRSGLTGVIPTVELHHTSGIGGGGTATVAANSLQIPDGTSQTNIVAGTTLEFSQISHLTIGYAGELDDDELADGAFRLMFSRER